MVLEITSQKFREVRMIEHINAMIKLTHVSLFWKTTLYVFGWEMVVKKQILDLELDIVWSSFKVHLNCGSPQEQHKSLPLTESFSSTWGPGGLHLSSSSRVPPCQLRSLLSSCQGHITTTGKLLELYSTHLLEQYFSLNWSWSSELKIIIFMILCCKSPTAYFSLGWVEFVLNTVETLRIVNNVYSFY